MIVRNSYDNCVHFEQYNAVINEMKCVNYIYN